MEEREDLYELLGLPGGADGAQVQDSELRKAYRRRALECHPDKRPNDANAAAQFARLQQAYEVLSDEKARKAYDEVQLLRKQRIEKQTQFHAQMSAKRQKMMEELHQREAAFELQRKQKVAEDNAAKRLKEEMARIRAKNAQKMNSRVFAASNSTTNPATTTDSFLSEEDKDRTLKVSWDSTSKPVYSAESLRQIFERIGKVEDVLIMLKKKKGTALVVMELASAAHAATQMQCGEISNPLLIVPVGLPSRAASSRKVQQQEQQQQAAAAAKSPPSSTSSALAGSGFNNREDMVLRKLYEAEERKKIIAEMEAEDKA